MVSCTVQLDEEKRIQVPDEIIEQFDLKPSKVFDIYIDTRGVNKDLYEQLITNLIHEGIIIETNI